jgi:diguanylate cyclase (GGDEF)-like protein/PAS domain S-box-containing protein
VPPAPLPENETRRLAALHELRILDSKPDPALNALVKAAALACGVPIALVNLVDANRCWFRARYGVQSRTEEPRGESFCAYTILSDAMLEVPDARQDPRFADNRYGLTGAGAIRSYAGVPLKLRDGSIAGTLCVLGRAPMTLNSRQREILRALGGAVAQALEQWRSDQQLHETLEALRISQEFLQRTGQLAGVGGWSMDLATCKITWSPATFDIYGVPAGEPPDLQTGLGFFSDRSQAHMIEMTAAVAPGEVFEFELPFTRGDGSTRWIRSMGTVIREAGKPDRMVGASMDITKAHSLAADLAEQHELLRVTLRSIGDGVITTDPAGITTWMNPVAERLTGWTHATATGRQLTEIFVVKDETGRLLESPVLACLEQRQILRLSEQSVLISRSGEAFGIEDSAAPIRNESGEIIGAVLVFRDVTEARRMRSEMAYRATHDSLTGLLNRAEFERRLGLLVAPAQPGAAESVVLFIDLDQFKLVNDTCGHPAGDQLLMQIGKLLLSHVRAGDCVARLGGDEFAILLNPCTVAEACRLAQRICDRMEAYRYKHGDQRFRVGASIGLAPVDHRFADSSAVLQAADACCYAAKMGGRNRVHLWSDGDRELQVLHGQARWAARLERALDDDRFVLFGQRIHPFEGRHRGLHAEVLLRMVDGNGALLPPGAFLPAAERFHMAARIDRWVLSHALQWMRELPDIQAVELLAINISGQSIGDREFQPWALAELGRAGPMISERICLEITETVAVTNLADASHFIERLRRTGARVALDDFGAGASSFGYLKSMGVDFLKIDGQFVRDILTDRLDEVAVRCFVQIAKVLGLRTIAEYTETAAVLEGLRAIGVDYAQGYHVHRPSPLAQLLAPALLPAPVIAA